MDTDARMRWISPEPKTVAGGPPDVCKNPSVSGIPSLFGQIVALSSQARAESDTTGKINPQVSLAWQATFLRWLCLDLAAQKSDLDYYAEWLGRKASETLASRCLTDLGRLAPPDASEAERRLFLSETRALFDLAGPGQSCRRG